jgi:hypothetical protein
VTLVQEMLLLVVSTTGMKMVVVMWVRMKVAEVVVRVVLLGVILCRLGFDETGWVEPKKKKKKIRKIKKQKI